MLSAVGSPDLAAAELEYGVDSPCWDDEEAAADCALACRRGADAQVELTPTVGVCWASGPPRATRLFEELGDEWPYSAVEGTGDLCEYLVGGALYVDAASDTFGFWLGFPPNAGGTVYVTFGDGSCRLQEDFTFACSGSTGAFSDDFHTITIDWDGDCLLTAHPL